MFYQQLDTLYYIRHLNWFKSICLVALFLIYVCLPNYDPYLYRMDDAWFTSIIYNYMLHGIETDEVFGGDITNGMGGTQLFGKIYVFCYGGITQLFQVWTKQELYLLSTTFVIFSIFLWYNILRILKIDKWSVLTISGCMLYIDTFFSAAHSVRIEGFILFFISLSFYLTLTKNYALSLLVSCIAIETHPVGVVAWFLNFPVLFQLEHRLFISQHLKMVISTTLVAALVSVLGYGTLHFNYLSRLWELSQASVPFSLANNFLYRYYFETRYYRHIPELIAILLIIFLYVRNRLYQENIFVFYELLSILLFSTFLGRGNFAYTVLIYPILVLFVFYTMIRLNRLYLVVVVIFCLYTPQYLFLYFKGTDVASDNDYKLFMLQSVSNYQNLPVVGLPNDYFVFIQQKTAFYHLCYLDTEKFRNKVKTAILIEHPVSELDKYYRGLPCENLANLNDHYHKRLITRLQFMNQPLNIYEITRKDPG